MKLKFLQLNIFLGKFLDGIIQFIQQKDIDVLHFQEVARSNKSFSGIDCFDEVKKRLNYNGELALGWQEKGDATPFLNVASFYKQQYKLKNKQVLWLKDKPTKGRTDKKRYYPRQLLTLLLEVFGCEIWFINTHLPWGNTPDDEDYKLEQGRKLYKFVRSLKQPFILSGDFNLTPDSQIVRRLNKFGRNLTVENNITNTLNSKTHYAKKLFPHGLAVDYIYIDRQIKVKKFEVLNNINLSDHLALYLEIIV